MSRVTTVQCDVCGKIKGETNGWFQLIASTADERIVINLALDFEPDSCLDICSTQCLREAIGKAIQKLREGSTA